MAQLSVMRQNPNFQRFHTSNASPVTNFLEAPNPVNSLDFEQWDDSIQVLKKTNPINFNNQINVSAPILKRGFTKLLSTVDRSCLSCEEHIQIFEDVANDISTIGKLVTNNNSSEGDAYTRLSESVLIFSFHIVLRYYFSIFNIDASRGYEDPVNEDFFNLNPRSTPLFEKSVTLLQSMQLSVINESLEQLEEITKVVEPFNTNAKVKVVNDYKEPDTKIEPFN